MRRAGLRLDRRAGDANLQVEIVPSQSHARTKIPLRIQPWGMERKGRPIGKDRVRALDAPGHIGVKQLLRYAEKLPGTI